MKRYLTAICIGLSMISVIVSFRFDVRWNGIAAWGLACLFLLCAAYFTRYIPNNESNKDSI
ncbi:hypothetical protein SPD48_00115 [Pseudogracilibacillus sp. SE30717A]|uniref:hypothetical protein n=1 Tax=Pseudogracilibacillus sp. SE30717A TaxID=3098293 RepID=UPI00300DF75A